MHEHLVACMLRSHLQSAAHMIAYQFARIFLRRPVGFLVLSPMQQQVVAHTTSNKTLFDVWQSIHGPIHLKQFRVIGVEIGAYLRMNATRSLAFLACLMIASVHAVHICRRAAEVAQVTLEIGHLRNFLYLAQHAFAGAAHDEFALMCRNGAESTAAEAAAMQAHGKLNHLVGRDALALIFGVGQAGVWQVERAVDLLRRHWGKRRGDDQIPGAYLLEDALRVQFVALFFDVAEVGGVGAAVALIFSIVFTVQKQDTSAIIGGYISVYGLFAMISQIIWGNSVADVFAFFKRSFTMPGVIFTLDIDGIIWAICVKILLSILSVILSVLCLIVGLFVTMFYAMILFPFGLVGKIREVNKV